METELAKNAETAGATEGLTTLRRRRRIAALAIPFLLFLTPWLQEAAPLLSLGLLIYCLLLTAGIRRLWERLGATPPAAVKLSTAKTIGWAVGLFVFDGLVLGQGIISAVVLACSVLYFVPMGIFSRDKTLGRFRLKKAGILATAMLAALGSIYLNNRIAERVADRLVSAVVQYREKYGQYPERLEGLVPEFMPGIPLAKFTLFNNNFNYSSFITPMLWYVELPPAGRRVYYFETGRWGRTMD